MLFLPDHALARINFMLIIAMTAIIIAQVNGVQIRYLCQPQFNVPSSLTVAAAQEAGYSLRK